VINPQRGEIWLVDLNPTIGQEMQKTRPVAIISTNGIDEIALRIVIPITSWQEKFAYRLFMVKISPTPGNDCLKTPLVMFFKSEVCLTNDLSGDWEY
jgi:mRNA interferase MazF